MREPPPNGSAGKQRDDAPDIGDGPELERIGTSPPSRQSTGSWACWRRWGEVEVARRFGIRAPG